MARPTKQGLDYFPMDCHFKTEVELIEAEFGLQGVGCLVRLWQLIYAEGYYIEWNPDTALLFSRRHGIDLDTLEKLIHRFIHRNIFSVDKYETYGILTSSGIQKRYIEACKSSKRKHFRLKKELDLLEEIVSSEETPVSSEETPINSEETPINSGGKYTKESKVNKSILNNNNKKENNYKNVLHYKAEAVDKPLSFSLNYCRSQEEIDLVNRCEQSEDYTAEDYQKYLEIRRRRYGT